MSAPDLTVIPPTRRARQKRAAKNLRQFAENTGTRQNRGPNPKGFKMVGVATRPMRFRAEPSMEQFILRASQVERRSLQEVTRSLILIGMWAYERLARHVLTPDAIAVAAGPAPNPAIYLADRAVAEALANDIIANPPEAVPTGELGPVTDTPKDNNPAGAQQAPSAFDAHYQTVDTDDEETGDPAGEPFETPDPEED